MHKTWFNAALVSLAGAALAFSVPAHAGDGIREATAYGVSEFGPAPSCGTSDMSHTYHIDSAEAFANEFIMLDSLGMWDSIYGVYDTAVRGTYWTDASQSSPADDNDAIGADSADVVYIHTHGLRTLGDPSYTTLWMGNSSYECKVNTHDDMLFGNTDLNVAVIKACNSADYDVWLDHGYKQLVNDSGEFTMWNGFHGLSSCGSWVTTYVGNYAAESVYDGVGENWLDEAYDPSSDGDDCPTSVVFGNSSTNRSDMYHWGGWKDLKDTASKTGSTFWYMKGCTAAGAGVSVLPS